MTQPSESRELDSFQHRLAELRLRIDSLPESQRGHLYALADSIAERHQHMQQRLASQHDDA